jgi:hypothetical protein
MSFAENLAPFFDLSEFADTATLGGVAVVGIMDAGFADATLAGYGVAGSSPRFTLLAGSVPAHPEGLALVVTSGVAAGTYKVGQAQPDGVGLMTLVLITHIT